METSHRSYEDQTSPQITERKVFWIVVAVLGLLDLFLPVWLALTAAIPIVIAAWWIAYQSAWLRRRIVRHKNASAHRSARNKHAA